MSMALEIPIALKGLDYYCCFSHMVSYLFPNKVVSNPPIQKKKKFQYLMKSSTYTYIRGIYREKNTLQKHGLWKWFS